MTLSGFGHIERKKPLLLRSGAGPPAYRLERMSKGSWCVFVGPAHRHLNNTRFLIVVENSECD